ncbi:MAG TPA: transporter [Planctomycetota bacterium]
MPTRSPLSRALQALCLLGSTGVVLAQDIEPRRWTPFPSGSNVAGLAYSYSTGDIDFDPVLAITDAEVDLHTAVATYVRAIGLWGKAARLDVRVPYQDAHWEGLLDGAPASRRRQGFADPLLRLSMNLSGPPTGSREELQRFRATHASYTILGIALGLQLPLGEYQEEKLLNLGQNRFRLRPQVGVLHERGPWSGEITASTSFFTDNDEFFGDSTLEQDPLHDVQAHVVRELGARWWAAAGAAYAWDGASTLDGADKDDEKGDLLFGLSLGCPLGQRQSLRVGYVGTRTQEDTGTDSDGLFLSWTMLF